MSEPYGYKFFIVGYVVGIILGMIIGFALGLTPPR